MRLGVDRVVDMAGVILVIIPGVCRCGHWPLGVDMPMFDVERWHARGAGGDLAGIHSHVCLVTWRWLGHYYSHLGLTEVGGLGCRGSHGAVTWHTRLPGVSR